ncbi:MAG: YigZ family protein [Bacteroidales bacterium]
MESDSYLTIKASSQGLYKEKGSRFIGLVWPVTSTDEVRQIIESTRKEYHDARHHCFAYMLGRSRTTYRVSDDGEPSGAAGRPILAAINSAGLTDILIIVVRYFGGKLLGAGGLARAYRTAAEAAIGTSEVTELHEQAYYDIIFPYQAMNKVMSVLKENDVTQSAHRFENSCSMRINFRRSAEEKILSALSAIDGLKYAATGAGEENNKA